MGEDAPCHLYSMSQLSGWLWQPRIPGMAGYPVLGDRPITGLGSPPSFLAGHNGLVAVSTKHRVLSPPSLGDAGGPGRICTVGKGGCWWQGPWGWGLPQGCGKQGPPW